MPVSYFSLGLELVDIGNSLQRRALVGGTCEKKISEVFGRTAQISRFTQLERGPYPLPVYFRRP